MGPEGNFYSLGRTALGGVLGFDLGVGPRFAGGLRLGLYTDLDVLNVIEPEAFFRWYCLSLKSFRIFLQGDLGAAIIGYRGRGIYPGFLAGLSAGTRFPLGSWYVEPYLRGGYPHGFGAGLLFVSPLSERKE